MKVLVVTDYIDRSEAALYTGLVRAGLCVDVVCNPAAPRAREIREAGLTVTPLAVRHRLDLKRTRILRRLLLRKSYDVVYAPSNRTLSTALMATRGLPVQCIGYRGTIGHLSRWDPAAWLTYLHPRVRRIVCVSNAVRRYLLTLRLPESRLVTIYKGHDPKWYASVTPAERAMLGVPDDVFLVGFAGAIRPVKGVDVLMKAVAGLPRAENVHLLLVGELRDRRVLRLRRSLRDPRIHFTGYRQDAPALIKSCDAFVMPSLSREGLPRAVIEAMAQEVVPIVTRVGGMPELVPDRHCGLVVPPGDPETLASAIRVLAEDDERRRQFARRARERIETHFHIDTTIEKMRALFEEVHRPA